MKRESTAREFAIILGLTLFSGYVLTIPFFRSYSLPWDSIATIGAVHDQLHALNRFAEFEFWAPHLQFGWPVFHHSVIGSPNVLDPIFASFSLVYWALGRIGIFPEHYTSAYLFYFGFFAPFFYLTALYYLAKELFQDARVRFFLLAAAAFGPAHYHVITDVFCLTPTLWALFVFLAYIRVLRLGTPTSFVGLALASSGFGLAFNYAYLFCNFVWVPAVLCLLTFFPRGHFARFKELCKTQRPGIALVVGALLCSLLPLIIERIQSRGFVPMRGEGGYSFEAIKAGNPLEFLFMSVAGIGTWWSKGYFAAPFLDNLGVRLSDGTDYLVHNYLGLLALPLFVVGMLRGRLPYRYYLLTLTALFFSVVVLTSLSPFLEPFFFSGSPLRFVNHLGDSTFKLGGHVVALLGAALGLDALLRNRRGIRSLFWKAFWGGFALSCLVQVAFAKMAIFSNTRFGLTVFLQLLFGVLFYHYFETHRELVRRKIMTAILGLTLIDVATFANFTTRETAAIPRNQRHVVEERAEMGVGMGLGSYASFALSDKTREALGAAHIDPSLFPPLKLYQKVRWVSGPPSLDEKPSWTQSVPLVEDPKRPVPRFSLSGQPARGSAIVSRKTYNTLEIEVQNSEPSVLFIRNGFSPDWKATVNGQPAEILRAFWSFQAVPVPAGSSLVKMRFRPRYFPEAIALNLAIWLGLLLTLFALKFPFPSKILSLRLKGEERVHT